MPTEGLLKNLRTAARRAHCSAVDVLKLTVELDGTRALRHEESTAGLRRKTTGAATTDRMEYERYSADMTGARFFRWGRLESCWGQWWFILGL